MPSYTHPAAPPFDPAIQTEISEAIRLYCSDAPLWTREALHSLEHQLASGQSTVDVRNLQGQLIPQDISPRPNEAPRISFIQWPRPLLNVRVDFSSLTDPSRAAIDLCRARALSTLSVDSRPLPWHRDGTCSLDALQHAWAEGARFFRRSPMYTALTNICRHGHPDDNPWAWGLGHSLVPALARVRSIMAFGLGPPDHPEYGGTDACASVSTSGRRYISQHLAAVAMAHALGRLHPDAGALPIHAQDPAYSPQAAAFLSDVGINVVDGCGARAFTMIDDDCLVYACGPNAPVRQIVAEIARPAVLVWDRARPPPYRADQDPYAMDLAFNKRPGLDLVSPRTMAMLEGYHRVDLPRHADFNDDMVVYIREDGVRQSVL